MSKAVVGKPFWDQLVLGLVYQLKALAGDDEQQAFRNLPLDILENLRTFGSYLVCTADKWIEVRHKQSSTRRSKEWETGEES